ncbi:hypothetical protein BLS_004664 [Venturia inaequalis]|uniref:Uncharacterized protein n=1 Tax=Venturia inaequalis TaxID=5025 RepID=A0A8H3YT49_VENIN|nr:hypothetical protein BLS_004664 [Venturia inaequalis]KAE9977951.1 hypothetical protein EG328_001744 [Venturia inaequalis]KAE9986637.1 hypothetical protein EG327_004229 [Venturia inaequalis]
MAATSGQQGPRGHSNILDDLPTPQRNQPVPRRGSINTVPPSTSNTVPQRRTGNRITVDSLINPTPPANPPASQGHPPATPQRPTGQQGPTRRGTLDDPKRPRAQSNTSSGSTPPTPNYLKGMLLSKADKAERDKKDGKDKKDGQGKKDKKDPKGGQPKRKKV